MKPRTRAAEVRDMVPHDLEGVLTLYREIFGHAYAERFEARYSWAHRDNLYPHNSPKWVVADGDRIVGFLAAMPLPYTIAGQRVIAHTTCDYMVHPDFRFHGIKLMKQFFSECANCVTCDDIEATKKVTEWLGAKTVTPMVTYLKVLNGRALAASTRLAGLPEIVYASGTALLKLADKALMAGSGGVHVENVDDFDSRFDEFSDRTAKNIPATVAKDRDFLRWRYGEKSPHSSRDIAVATSRDGSMLGYAITYMSSEERPTGYVLDLQAERGPHEIRVTRSLLAHAARTLRARGAVTMKYHAVDAPDSTTESHMKRMGFLTRNRTNRVLMVKFSDPALQGIAEQPGNWNYRYGDAEVSHSLA